MVNARIYQKQLRKKLINFFDEVDYERTLFKDANDILIHDPERYSPRLDLVIGPYNLQPGVFWKDKEKINKGLFLSKNRNTRRFFEAISGLKLNPNPRYAVAIEVVFSGSSKHILGDITNASTLGLYGFVIASEGMLLKAQRILKHLQTLKGLGKIAPEMFNNVKVVSTTVFDSYFS